jgi:deoxyuridine 5''-triphosphate nucleotidohydrolase (dut)
MEVQIKLLKETAKLPEYATPGSAAADLHCAEDAPVTIEPGARALLSTGIAIAIPSADIVALIFPRSGLSSKFGITLSNCVGVIDSDYRGEIKVSLSNTSKEPYTVNPGDRIAQILFTNTLHPALTVTDELSETQRGAGGFGSTGS